MEFQNLRIISFEWIYISFILEFRMIGLFFIILSAFMLVCHGLFSSTELQALQDLYTYTNGKYWNWRSYGGQIWDFSTGVNTNPCTWQGLNCTQDLSHVAEVHLSNYQLHGVLPVSIGGFPYLTVLDLSYNILYGTIPNQIGYDEGLTKLDLSYGFLAGTIPLSIGNLLFIQTLDLSSNFLTGSIPIQLTYCTRLKSVDLYDNALTGSIPSQIQLLNNLTVFSASFNQLTGTIPSKIGGCTGTTSNSTLVLLDLQSNSLSGRIPESLYTHCVQLQSLLIANNTLHGSISQTIASATNLLHFVVAGNMLTGSLPDKLGNLTKLLVLDASSNHLIGTIPMTFARLTRLYEIFLDHNQLQGSIPCDIFYNMTNLYAMFVGDNQLTGTVPNIPYVFGKNTNALIALGLHDNYFNGTIPSSITSYTNLIYLDLDSAYFSGPIPNTIGNLVHLRVLSLFGQFLTGPIPETLYSCTNLQILLLYSNDLNGTLSSSMGNLVHLQSLYLTANHIKGHIPTTIGNMHSIKMFYLRDNELSGPIPYQIGYLNNVSTIDLSGNQLTGTIPPSLVHLKLAVLDLSSNKLHTTIPDFLSSIPTLQWLSLSNSGLYSTIPTSLSKLNKLRFLDLRRNALTGTLPQSLSFLDELNFFLISYNQLSGNISSVINHLPNLTYVNISFNHFSESFSNINFATDKLTVFVAGNNDLRDAIGTAFRESTLLQALNLANNQLTGQLTNIPPLLELQTVDLSGNQFTGTIPSNFFESERLISFSAVSNCLSGPLPIDTICKSTTLQTIALDGMFAADACQYKLLPFASNAYQAKLIDIGDLTRFKCIFNIPSLQTLHLSGNGILGSIPDDLMIGAELADLTLSYNRLTGAIPKAVTARSSWKNLDLSFNKLNGSLDNNFASPSNETNLVLRDNRLSGSIPSSLLHAEEINILEGNMFSCESNDLVTPYIDKRSLPTHDHHHEKYSCGSDFVNTNLLLWAAVVFGLLFILRVLILIHSKTKWRWLDKVCSIMAKVKGLLVGYKQISREGFKKLDAGRRQTQAINGILYIRFQLTMLYERFLTLLLGPSIESSFLKEIHGDKSLFKIIIHVEEYMKKLRDTCIELTMFAVCVLLPLYVVIGHYYNTHENSYVWDVSVAYKSGVVPAVVIFAFLLAFYAYEFGNLNYYFSLPVMMNKYFDQLHEHFRILHYYQSKNNPDVHQQITDKSNSLDETNLRNSVMSITSIGGAPKESLSEDVQNKLFASKSEKGSDSVASSGTIFWVLSLIFPDVQKKEEKRHSRIRGIFITFLCLINFIAVIVVNSYYVLAHLEVYPYYADPLITLSVVLFKLFWADIVVTGIFNTLIDESYREYQSHNSTDRLKSQFRQAKKITKAEMTVELQDELDAILQRQEEKRYSIDSLQRIKLLTFLNILNDIIIPFLVFAVVDSNCFLYIFVNQEPVDVSYQRLSCGEFHWDTDFHIDRYGNEVSSIQPVCSNKVFFTATTSYDPPFVYSYQCASSLLNTFVSIILYEYFLPAIFFPFVGFILNALGHDNKFVQFVGDVEEHVHKVKHGARGWFKYLLGYWYEEPPVTAGADAGAHSSKKQTSTPKHSHDQHEHHHEDKYKESIDEFVMSILTNISVLMTFGFAFPLLGIIVGVNVCITTIRYELIIHKCIKDANKENAEKTSTAAIRYSLTLKTLQGHNSDELNMFTVERLQLIRASIPLIFMISASFLSIFMFDILGDTIGFLQAIWILILLPLLTYLMRLLSFFYRRYMKRVDNLYEELTTEDDDEEEGEGGDADQQRRKNREFSDTNPMHDSRFESAEMMHDNEEGIRMKPINNSNT